MRQKSTQKVFAHWAELVRKDAPPDRNDIDPAAIAGALQDIFILGRGADGIWRYRVAGTRLLAYADRDLRGEAYTAWWRPEDRADMARLLATTAEDKTPVVGGVRAVAVRGERHELELILLPLRHGGMDGMRMLGGLFPGPETTRLYDVRLDNLAVASLRCIADVARETQVFGRRPADLDQMVERRHGLRVIEGGRIA